VGLIVEALDWTETHLSSRCFLQSALLCLHFREPCRTEHYSHGLIDSHVRADHQVVEASVCPVALVVAANVRRSRTVEFVERGFTISGVREARLDPLEFFLPRATPRRGSEPRMRDASGKRFISRRFPSPGAPGRPRHHLVSA